MTATAQAALPPATQVGWHAAPNHGQVRVAVPVRRRPTPSALRYASQPPEPHSANPLTKPQPNTCMRFCRPPLPSPSPPPDRDTILPFLVPVRFSVLSVLLPKLALGA